MAERSRRGIRPPFRTIRIAIARVHRPSTTIVVLGISLLLVLLSAVAGLAQPGEEARSAPAGATRTWSDLGKAPVTTLRVDPARAPGWEAPRLDPQRQMEASLQGRAPALAPGPKRAPKTELDPRLGLGRGLRAAQAPPGPSAPTAFVSFEGPDNLNNSAECGYVTRPPDPDIAVGPNHVVVVTNVLIAVYNKSGSLLKIACLDAWFGNVHNPASDGGIFDPRVAYDPHEGRWIVIALARLGSPQKSWYLVSVSQTSDPTGAWWNWRLEGLLNTVATGNQNAWADYPDLGFDGIPSTSGAGGAVYITANYFDFNDIFQTNGLNILPKKALYSGSSFSYWLAWGRQNAAGFDAFTLRTAKVWDNGQPEYLVNTVGSFYDQVSLWRVTPTFPPTAVDWVLQATLTVGDYSFPPNATQKGCPNELDTISNRMYNAIVRGGKLYSAFTEGVDFGSGIVAAVRYLKIDTTTSNLDLDVRFGADGIHHWFPAIVPDASGNLSLVYARSSPSEYASVYYTGRRTTDSTTQAGALLKAGQLCITGFRWGDYFGAAPDPSDGTRVWIYGEWAKDLTGVSSDWDWGTWIAQVGFGNPNPTAAVFTVSKEGTVSSDRAYFCGRSSGCFNTGTGADLAERIDVTEPVEPGDVVEVDPQNPGRYRKARGPYSPWVAGIIATQPGITLANRPQERQGIREHLEAILRVSEAGIRPLLGALSNRASSALENPWKGTVLLERLAALREGALVPYGESPKPFSLSASLASLTGEQPLSLLKERVLARLPGRPLLALMGRVYVKATAENGPILPGDLLTTASKPGYAMRCPSIEECAGAILGKALEPLEEGEGLIEVLVLR